MNENYIVINGKRAELTKEQLKMLGIETKKSPFSIEEGEQYWYTGSFGGVNSHFHTRHKDDKLLIDACNAFNDNSFANQVALHQLLYRKLLKFAYDNECEASATWDGNEAHYSINYVAKYGEFIVVYDSMVKSTNVYFCSESAANNAIKNVILPFMEEHPEFIW